MPKTSPGHRHGWKAFKSPGFSIIKARLKQLAIFGGRNMFEPSDINALSIIGLGGSTIEATH